MKKKRLSLFNLIATEVESVENSPISCDAKEEMNRAFSATPLLKDQYVPKKSSTNLISGLSLMYDDNEEVGTAGVINDINGLISSLFSFLLGLFKFIKVILRRDSFVACNRVEAAENYEEWKIMVREVESQSGFKEWSEGPDCRHLYDHDGLVSKVNHLKQLYESEEGPTKFPTLLQEVRNGLTRTTFGVLHPKLYEKYQGGTKKVIKDYFKVIHDTMNSTAVDTHSSIYTRLKLLNQCSRIHGTSALILSGSATLGMYHLGVVKALAEANSLPNVIYGNNTGAFVAALVCCSTSTTRALGSGGVDLSAFNNREHKGSLKRKITRLMREGTLIDTDVLINFAQSNIGNITFEEAYKATGRILNIQVRFHGGACEDKYWLLNYITTPQVIVHSAALLSCYTRGLYKAVPLLCKLPSGKIVKYCPPQFSFGSCDGMATNSSLERMRQLFNVNFFVISECSVTRLPFFESKNRGLIWQTYSFFAEEFWRYINWVLKFFFKNRFTKIFRSSALVYPQPSIVIHPASSLGDITRILQNPNRQLLERCERAGQRKVWPRIQEIKSHIAVSISIDKAIKALMTDAAAASCSTFTSPYDTHLKKIDAYCI
eukprot:Tbor_TRINITY_DN4727_c1_g2::TRINITY_DN4727_c1_g2_i1::g.16885::m.16885